MDATGSDTLRITTANVRVPLEEFLAVWREADRRRTGAADDRAGYAGAVAQTCRWLAAVPLRTALCGGLPRSPVTLRASVARAELIDAESSAADRGQFAADVAGRGWCDGVRATFRWAWHGDGPPPLDVPGA